TGPGRRPAKKNRPTATSTTTNSRASSLRIADDGTSILQWRGAPPPRLVTTTSAIPHHFALRARVREVSGATSAPGHDYLRVPSPLRATRSGSGVIRPHPSALPRLPHRPSSHRPRARVRESLGRRPHGSILLRTSGFIVRTSTAGCRPLTSSRSALGFGGSGGRRLTTPYFFVLLTSSFGLQPQVAGPTSARSTECLIGPRGSAHGRGCGRQWGAAGRLHTSSYF